MFEKIPLPIAGVMLGFAALGNLLQDISNILYYICGGIAVIIGILLLLKFSLYFKYFKADMEDPLTASISGTFSMALMLLAGYLEPFSKKFSSYLWFLAIVLHAALIMYFTVRFIFHLNIQKVFASYFIVYVGIAAAGISAPASGYPEVGKACVYFGMIAFVALSIPIAYRYIRYRNIDEPYRPFFCITAAPASLCLAGYIRSVTSLNTSLIIGMAVVASLLYLLVLCRLPGLLRHKFYPSCAAFTFPFVISATAIKMTGAYLAGIGRPLELLSVMTIIETVIAVALVVYTFVRFIKEFGS